MDSRYLCLDPAPACVSPPSVRPAGTGATASEPRLSCLLANDDAEEVKQTTIAFRSVLPAVRIEAVYSTAEAIEWATKEAWPIILFAERLAIAEGLSRIAHELRERLPQAAIVIQGEQDVPPRFMLTEDSPADFYWTRRLGHAGNELPLLTIQLVQKRALRRRLDMADRLGKQIEDILSSASALIRSAVECERTERQAHGLEQESGVCTKVAAAERALTELVTVLSRCRQDPFHPGQGVSPESMHSDEGGEWAGRPT